MWLNVRISHPKSCVYGKKDNSCKSSGLFDLQGVLRMRIIQNQHVALLTARGNSREVRKVEYDYLTKNQFWCYIIFAYYIFVLFKLTDLNNLSTGCLYTLPNFSPVFNVFENFIVAMPTLHKIFLNDLICHAILSYVVWGLFEGNLFVRSECFSP